MTDKRRVRRWPLYLIGSSAAVAVWSGWVGLGTLSGFGVIHPLPGIWDSFHLNTAITLPVGVEAYAAYAMGAWMSPDTPKTARTFAKRSTFGSLFLGMFGQIAYHLLAAAHVVHAPWEITTAVSCLPVVTLGFAAALIHLLHLGHEDEAETEQPQRSHPAEPVAGPSPETLARVQASLPTVASPRPAPPTFEEPEDRPTPRLDRTLASRAPWEQPYSVTHPQRAADQPAPWDDPSWTQPAPPRPAEPEPDTQAVNQVVGTVHVRSPLSRLDRKVPVDERVTGSFPAIRD